MQSIAIPRRGLSPLSIGLIIAFSLFFVIVAIVRNVTAPTPQIGQVTAAGVASVQVPAQSNVTNALPAFSLQSQAQPATHSPVQLQPSETPFVSDPPVRFMTAEEEALFNNHEWLAVAYDRGVKNVYGGAWFPCRHIDADLLTYNTVHNDPALVVWAKMAPSDQNEIAKECQKP